MKFKKTLCALIAAVTLAVPIISGCSNRTADTYKAFWNSAQSVSEPSTKESSIPPADSSLPSSSLPEGSLSGETNTPAVWQAEDRNGHLIYLMGTIHVGDESIYNLPDYVEHAYQYSDAIAVEADISDYMSDNSKAASYVMKMMYTDGTTIQDHISPEVYNGLKDLMTSNGMYSPMYDQYKPFMWTSLLTMMIDTQSGLDYYHGFDLIMTNRAKNDKKDVLEVESIDFQLDLFNSFSDELNNLMLSEYLKPNYAAETDKATKNLYECWKKGTVDETMVTDGTFVDMNEKEQALYDEYNEKLVLTRNRSMAQKAEEYLTSGQKVFFLVGALHFYGEGGIIDLLQKDGYTITPIH